MATINSNTQTWIFIYPILFILIASFGSYMAGVNNGKILMCKEMNGTLTLDYGCLDTDFVNQALVVQTSFPAEFRLYENINNTVN